MKLRLVRMLGTWPFMDELLQDNERLKAIYESLFHITQIWVEESGSWQCDSQSCMAESELSSLETAG